MPGRLWGASSGRAKATPVVLAVLHEWTQERREAREVLWDVSRGFADNLEAPARNRFRTARGSLC